MFGTMLSIILAVGRFMLLLFLGTAATSGAPTVTGVSAVVGTSTGGATGAAAGAGLDLGIILENIPNIDDIPPPDDAALGADADAVCGVLATLPACWKIADDTNVIMIVISGPNDVLPDHL